MKSFINTLSLIGIIFSLAGPTVAQQGVPGEPDTVDPRIRGINELAVSVLSANPGMKSCCDNIMYSDDFQDKDEWYSCRVLMGESLEGQKWMACWHNHDFPPLPNGEDDTGTWRSTVAAAEIAKRDTKAWENYTIDAGDVEAMKCLTNYHFQHRENCVKIEDTECSYREYAFVKRSRQTPMTDQGRFSAQCSRTFQSAEDAMLGRTIQLMPGGMFFWTTHQNWKVSKELYIESWNYLCDQ